MLATLDMPPVRSPLRDCSGRLTSLDSTDSAGLRIDPHPTGPVLYYRQKRRVARWLPSH